MTSTMRYLSSAFSIFIIFFVYLAKETARQTWADRYLHACIFLYVACSVALSLAVGQSPLATFSHYAKTMPFLLIFLLPALFFCFRLLVVARRFRNGRTTLALRKASSVRANVPLFSSLMIWISFIAFESAFTGIKITFPVIQSGFPFDRIHADIDAFIFFGDPWRHLMVVGGFQPVLKAVEISYNVLWHVLMMATLFYFVTNKEARAARMRFLTVLLATWVVCGSLLAAFFLSAGPVYYGNVTGDFARFSALSAFLAGSNEWYSAASYQAYLWNLHAGGTPGLGGGISAFPSVHIGVAVVNWLFVRERSKCLGMLLGAYAGFIWLSSIYLGWHYAIDGIVSAGIVVILYRITLLISPRYFSCEDIITAGPTTPASLAIDNIVR